MGTNIQWTDETWNPTRGCRRISPGCEHCYAEKQAMRMSTGAYQGLVRLGKQGPQWTGAGRFVPGKLDEPLRRRKPRKIFVDSMSDLFYEAFTFEQIAAVFGVMGAAPQHTFQVLTKRPERALAFFEWAASHEKDFGPPPTFVCETEAENRGANIDRLEPPWPLSNVWMGASVEDQQRAKERLDYLVRIPAAVRFVSYEPALEAVDFRPWLRPRDGIDWLIIGGESGHHARPFDLAWARQTRDACKAAGVAYFFKQGGSCPIMNGKRILLRDGHGGDLAEFVGPLSDLAVREFPNAR